MATFQQAYDAVAARYSDKLLDSLNPSGFIHEIYQELRRMDAEAVAEKLHPVTNPGKRAKRRNASIASFNRALNGREALHVSGCHETLLKTARRHVREGAERVTRQEAMVAELERDNHPDAATLAREVLKTMR
jgi:hypothetical protein